MKACKGQVRSPRKYFMTLGTEFSRGSLSVGYKRSVGIDFLRLEGPYRYGRCIGARERGKTTVRIRRLFFPPVRPA